MNELSTKITRLDLDYILDNCFKPALWDKKWTIFKYGKYKITFEIRSIDVKNKQVTCNLRLTWNDSYVNSQDTSYEINFQKEHRNLQVIQSGMNGRIYRWLIEWAERYFIRDTDAYKEAENYEDKLIQNAKARAIHYLNEKAVDDEEIRKAYIESEETRASTCRFTDQVFENYKGSKLTSLFLSYALFSGDEEAYEKYKKLAKARGFKIGHMRKEIEAELAKIEFGEMEEMK